MPSPVHPYITHPYKPSMRTINAFPRVYVQMGCRYLVLQIRNLRLGGALPKSTQLRPESAPRGAGSRACVFKRQAHCLPSQSSQLYQEPDSEERGACDSGRGRWGKPGRKRKDPAEVTERVCSEHTPGLGKTGFVFCVFLLCLPLLLF